MSREQAQELHGLSAKPAANLDADNDEAVFSDNVGSVMETFRGSRALLPGMGPFFSADLLQIDIHYANICLKRLAHRRTTRYPVGRSMHDVLRSLAWLLLAG